jgi:hypothetical protein
LSSQRAVSLLAALALQPGPAPPFRLGRAACAAPQRCVVDSACRMSAALTTVGSTAQVAVSMDARCGVKWAADTVGDASAAST